MLLGPHAAFIILAPLIVSALPEQPAASTLPSSLQTSVPDCARSCLATFLNNQFPLSCSSDGDLDCLCSQYSRNGFTLGEGALSCVYSSCSSTTDQQKSAFNICNSRSNAATPTHSILTVAPFSTTATPTPTSTNTQQVSQQAITTTAVPTSSSPNAPLQSSATVTSSQNATMATASSIATAQAASSGLNTAQLAGIIIASVALVILFISCILLILIFRRRRITDDDIRSKLSDLEQGPRTFPTHLKDPRSGGGVGCSPAPGAKRPQPSKLSTIFRFSGQKPPNFSSPLEFRSSTPVQFAPQQAYRAVGPPREWVAAPQAQNSIGVAISPETQFQESPELPSAESARTVSQLLPTKPQAALARGSQTSASYTFPAPPRNSQAAKSMHRANPSNASTWRPISTMTVMTEFEDDSPAKSAVTPTRQIILGNLPAPRLVDNPKPSPIREDPSKEAAKSPRQEPLQKIRTVPENYRPLTGEGSPVDRSQRPSPTRLPSLTLDIPVKKQKHITPPPVPPPPKQVRKSQPKSQSPPLPPPPKPTQEAQPVPAAELYYTQHYTESPVPLIHASPPPFPMEFAQVSRDSPRLTPRPSPKPAEYSSPRLAQHSSPKPAAYSSPRLPVQQGVYQSPDMAPKPLFLPPPPPMPQNSPRNLPYSSPRLPKRVSVQQPIQPAPEPSAVTYMSEPSDEQTPALKSATSQGSLADGYLPDYYIPPDQLLPPGYVIAPKQTVNMKKQSPKRLRSVSRHPSQTSGSHTLRDSEASMTSFETADFQEPTPSEHDDEDKALSPVAESPISGLRYPKVPRASNQAVPRSPNDSSSGNSLSHTPTLLAKRRGKTAASALEKKLWITDSNTASLRSSPQPSQQSDNRPPLMHSDSTFQGHRSKNSSDRLRKEATHNRSKSNTNNVYEDIEMQWAVKRSPPLWKQGHGMGAMKSPMAMTPGWTPMLTPERHGNDLYLTIS